jgi:hypothetical protein
MPIPLGAMPAVSFVIGAYQLVKFIVGGRPANASQTWLVWLLTISFAPVFLAVTTMAGYQYQIQSEWQLYAFSTATIQLFWIFYWSVAYQRNPESVAAFSAHYLYSMDFPKTLLWCLFVLMLIFLLTGASIFFISVGIDMADAGPCKYPKCRAGELMLGDRNHISGILFMINAFNSMILGFAPVSVFNRFFNNNWNH